MGKIYGYARVSTKNQRLDRQIKNIEDYCKDKKIERIYREKYTGTKMGRPQFQKLLSGVILAPYNKCSLPYRYA